MRKLLLIAAFAAVVAPFAGASADKGCDSTHTHTASGGCKENSGADKGQIHCATGDDANGQIPVNTGSVRFYVVPDEGEVEACNDGGSNQTRGRLVVAVRPDDGYARVSLDSTREQEPQLSAGYINVQAGPGAEQTGIWCSGSPQQGQAPNDSHRGDGYARPKNNPGTEGGGANEPNKWAECIPTQ